nr:EOG090X06HD [Cyclestheria hislopi]
MEVRGACQPTTEEIIYGAQRVENYACGKCGQTGRFPRYNDPGKLLETRKGRCGEWANCFTLICRSLQYDARHVLDWTDHVWCEVYSESQQRWLHCDPCEAVCDKPLLYEAGWGKKLSYVIAFSRHEVQDVTWRYTANYKEVLKRRQLVSESWLLQQTMKLTRSKQSSLPEEKRKDLTLRLVRELAEFLTPPNAKPGELQGRTSGDINWRKSRGELGTLQFQSYTWIPTETETKNGEFCLEYSASLDQYCRRSDGNQIIKDWSSGIFEMDSIFRKTERDWKMAYLARSEGSHEGTISWKFDLTPLKKYTILQVVVSCPGTTFHDGSIQWKLCGEDQCQLVPNGCVEHEVDLSGSKWCVLTAKLAKGSGDNAWQHTQIARQSMESDAYPLCLRVYFGSID